MHAMQFLNEKRCILFLKIIDVKLSCTVQKQENLLLTVVDAVGVEVEPMFPKNRI